MKSLLILLIPNLALSAPFIYINPNQNFYNLKTRRDALERQYYKFPKGFYSRYTPSDYHDPSSNIQETQSHLMKDAMQYSSNDILITKESQDKLLSFYDELKGDWQLVPNSTDKIIPFDQIQYLEVKDCDEVDIDSRFKDVENLEDFKCLAKMNVYQHKAVLSKEVIELANVATQYVLMNFDTNVLLEYIYDNNQTFVHYYDFMGVDYLGLSINHFATLNIADKIYAESSPAFFERTKKITPFVLAHYPGVSSIYLSDQHRKVSARSYQHVWEYSSMLGLAPPGARFIRYTMYTRIN